MKISKLTVTYKGDKHEVKDEDGVTVTETYYTYEKFAAPLFVLESSTHLMLNTVTVTGDNTMTKNYDSSIGTSVINSASGKLTL